MVSQKVYTNEEFHTFVERAEGKFEWVDGQIIALYSGEPVEESLVGYVLSPDFDRTQLPDFPMPTERHDNIVSNLHFYVRLALKGLPFKVYSQATYIRDNDWEKSRLPDIIVVDAASQQRNKRHEVTNPVLL
ncbi:MAG: Uma2 family endonuclease, partial [Cytophagales bacterium]|nr:Uma2 family endonuclease [Cytophagales bacterium]